MEVKVSNGYYDISTYTIDSIMKSQLLLDEDMEILNYYWHENTGIKKNENNNNTKLWICMPIGVASTTFCLYKNYKFYLAIAAGLAPSCLYFLLKLKNYTFKRNLCKNVDKFLSNSKIYCKLNLTIIEHFDKKYSQLLLVGNDSESNILNSLATKRSTTFLINTKKMLIEIIDEIRSCIEKIAISSNMKQIDYYLSCIEWNLNDYDETNLSDIMNIIEKFQILNQLYVLITSNFLTSFGLTICSNYDSTFICTKILPNLTNLIKTTYDKLSLSFNNLRFSLETVPKREKHFSVISRAEQPLLDFLRRIQIIFELGMALEDKLKMDKTDDIDNLLKCLETMCVEYKKSNTLLVAVQKILIKHKKKNLTPPIFDNDNFNNLNNGPDVNNLNTLVIRFDDPQVEIEDEEYTLSIHGSDEDDDDKSNKNEKYEDLLEQFVTQKMMIDELNNKLMAIRKKKGMDDINPQIPNRRKGDDKEAININQEMPNLENVVMKEQSSLIASSMFPPLPPPLPNSREVFLPLKLMDESKQIQKLELVGNSESMESDKTYIARAVKNCAIQLNRKEEVFSLDAADNSDSDSH